LMGGKGKKIEKKEMTVGEERAAKYPPSEEEIETPGRTQTISGSRLGHKEGEKISNGTSAMMTIEIRKPMPRNRNGDKFKNVRPTMGTIVVMAGALA